MPTSHHVREQMQKIDEQIIQLLAQRMKYSQEALEEDEEALSPEYISEVTTDWEAAAEENGWNMALVAKICRGILELCKHGGE